jgi:hypothetical protein
LNTNNENESQAFEPIGLLIVRMGIRMGTVGVQFHSKKFAFALSIVFGLTMN